MIRSRFALTLVAAVGFLEFVPAIYAAFPQTIGDVEVGVKAPADPPFNLPSVTSAGLPIEWEVLTGPANISGNTVTLTGATGAVTILGRQSGDSNNQPAANRYVTFPVSLGGGFRIVASGSAHAAAIRMDGSLWTWGRNQAGQLGDGTTTDRAIPQPIATSSGSPPWTAVACGGSHTLALRADGTLWAWGRNDDGQLGLGNNNSVAFPMMIGNLSGWARIACGFNHSAAIRGDGSLWTWGDNSQGHLGDGTIADRSSPVRVGSALDWAEVSGGAAHTVARRAGGSLWAWGGNLYGQLGDGSQTRRTTPVRIGTASDWREVSSGFFFSIARRTNGTLWAWGNNDSGQLGQGTRATRSSPTQIGTATDWETVKCGAAFAIGQTTDRQMWAWGDNSAGQLGNQTTQDVLAPEATLPGPWASVGAGAACVLAIKEGTLWTWGANDDQQLALPPASIGATAVPPAARLPYPTAQSIGALPHVAGLNTLLKPTLTSALPPSLRVLSGPATVSADGLGIRFTAGGNASIEVSHPGDLAWAPAAAEVFAIAIDVIGPNIDPAPANRVVQLETPSGTVVSYQVAATDAVTGPASIICVPPSGSTFPGGQTTVSCMAVDAFGNTTSHSFIIHVNRPPAFTLQGLTTVGPVPLGITLDTLRAAVSDPDLDPDLPLAGRGISLPASTPFTAAHGVVIWDGALLRYSASEGFSGPDTITFPYADGFGASLTATFQIEVSPPSSLPLDHASLAFTGEGKSALTFRANPGSNITIQRTANLMDWTSVVTQAVPANGLIYYVDPDSAALSRAYYRMVPAP